MNANRRDLILNPYTARVRIPAPTYHGGMVMPASDGKHRGEPRAGQLRRLVKAGALSLTESLILNDEGRREIESDS